MDASSHYYRPVLRRGGNEDPSISTGSFHCANAGRPDYRLGRLLRRAEVTAYSVGCALPEVVRTLSVEKGVKQMNKTASESLRQRATDNTQWLRTRPGEQCLIRESSEDTNGLYAVLEIVSSP